MNGIQPTKKSWETPLKKSIVFLHYALAFLKSTCFFTFSSSRRLALRLLFALFDVVWLDSMNPVMSVLLLAAVTAGSSAPPDPCKKRCKKKGEKATKWSLVGHPDTKVFHFRSPLWKNSSKVWNFKTCLYKPCFQKKYSSSMHKSCSFSQCLWNLPNVGHVT